MSLKRKIQEDMKAALKAKEQVRLGTIRLLLAAIQRREVDERITLDDVQVIAVVEKLIKQGREASEQYRQAGRQDLLDKEASEIAIFEAYLPEQLSEAEVQKLIAEAIAETGAGSIKDMGKVMGVLKPRLQGRADMGKTSAMVKATLSAS